MHSKQRGQLRGRQQYNTPFFRRITHSSSCDEMCNPETKKTMCRRDCTVRGRAWCLRRTALGAGFLGGLAVLKHEGLCGWVSHEENACSRVRPGVLQTTPGDLPTTQGPANGTSLVTGPNKPGQTEYRSDLGLRPPVGINKASRRVSDL